MFMASSDPVALAILGMIDRTPNYRHVTITFGIDWLAVSMGPGLFGADIPDGLR